MKERKQTTKYLLPVVFAMILVVVLAFGILFMRNSLMKLTIEERSSQLEEMGVSEVDTTGPKAEGYLMQRLVEQGGQLEAPTDYIILR